MVVCGDNHENFNWACRIYACHRCSWETSRLLRVHKNTRKEQLSKFLLLSQWLRRQVDTANLFQGGLKAKLVFLFVQISNQNIYTSLTVGNLEIQWKGYIVDAPHGHEFQHSNCGLPERIVSFRVWFSWSSQSFAKLSAEAMQKPHSMVKHGKTS